MRILGLDLGEETVGVALSDPFGWTAQGLTVIRRVNPTEMKQSMGELAKIITQYGVETIVLGYPLNLDGTKSVRCEKTEEYAARLQGRFPQIPVVLWDERFTTVSAHAVLREGGLDGKERKKVVDRTAAVLILQGYLDRLAHGAATAEETDKGE